MENISKLDEIPVRSLRKLMLLRLVVVTFLLGVAVSIQIKETISLPPESVRHVFSIIILTYFLSILYILLHKKLKQVGTNVHIQSLCDVGLITGLVYVTGGIESVYSVLYQLVIIYTTLFLGKKGGLISASACSIFFGLLLNLEFYGVITPYGFSEKYAYSAGYVLSRIFIHIASFYIVSIIVSFVVEQEKKSRSLLTEKESAFDQLDLLYRGIIEHVNAGIVTIDLMGQIKSFNKAAGEISGFEASEVVGENVDTFFPGLINISADEKEYKSSRDLTRKGEITILSKKKNNAVLGFSMSALMNSKDKKIGAIIIFQDLTATKEMEKEIEKSKNLALIGEMAAGLTHEIRNPLTAMSGSIQLLKKNLDLNETDAKLMQIVLRGREQLEKLVSNFLLLARPNLSNWVEMDLLIIIDEVFELILSEMDWNENIKIEKEFAADTQIYGNQTEIKQILYNLILNAVQAMPNGGRLKTTIHKTESDNGTSWLEVMISDSGEGIDKEKQGKIFNPFFTTKEKGTGLGLPIANRILESHGGSIEIKSEAGKGTTCTVMLPKKDRSPRKGTEKDKP